MKKPSISKRTLQEHPQYFGVFANMARHNVYLILHEIADRTGLPKPPGEESLHKSSVIRILDNTVPDKDLEAGKINRPDKCKHVIKLLNDHFRFLPLLNISLDAKNPDTIKYYQVMCMFLIQLDTTRNQYTHAIYNKTRFNKDLLKMLEIIFDEGLRDVKSRFALGEEVLNHLRRWKGKDKETDKPAENTAFEHRFYDNSDITENGLAFFISLFLEAEYSFLFLNKLDGFKSKSPVKTKAALETYVISRCKLPARKLQSTADDKTALLLDMLNELQRCPKKLFDTLRPEEQAKFEKSVSADDAETGNEEEDSKALLIRKQNRFPYFALRYIDHTQMFEKLRFQVDLGNYHYYSYDKQMDDQSIVRRWEKKLLSFGRLHEIDDKAKAAWKELIKDPSSINDATPAPFILQTQAHYNFDGGEQKNIALKAITAPGFVELPELKKGKEVHTKTQEPDFYLCTDELVGLLLYNHFVEEYKGKSTEEIFFSYRDRINNFLNEFIKEKISPIEKEKITNHFSAAALAKKISNTEFEKEYSERKSELARELAKYNLQPHQVPENLCKYLMGIEPVNLNERAERIIRFHIEETEILLKRAGGPGSREDKKTKKQLRKEQRNLHISAGDSALFLTKDMLYLQPPLKDKAGNPSPKGKANPDEFQLLQARLAFFGAEKENLERTFRLCRLIGSENPHPFLYKLKWKDCKESLAFYTLYLRGRKSFFLDLLKKKNYSEYYFLARNEKVRDKNYFIALAAEIKVKPTNLPRGLFKEALTVLLKQKGEQWIKKLFQDGNEKHNIVFLINELFKQSKDLYQTFYDLDRNYRTVDEWFDTRPEKSFKRINKLYKPPLELAQLADEIKKSGKIRKKKKPEDGDVRFYKIYADKVIENEKKIRHYRSSDQMLFMMCKDLLTKEDERIRDSFKSTFFLRDISPDNDKSILETRITYALPVKTNSGSIKYIEEEFKIKDYWKLRKYLKDRRLGSLLDYYTDERIKLVLIKDQLKDYEMYRIELLDAAFEFENACNKSPQFVHVINNALNEVKDGKPKNYVEHRALLKRYAEVYGLDNQEMGVLRILRNAFSHNEFPAKEKAPGNLKFQNDVLKQLMAVALPLYIACIEKIKAGHYE